MAFHVIGHLSEGDKMAMCTDLKVRVFTSDHGIIITEIF